jgi:hypothetical protein
MPFLSRPVETSHLPTYFSRLPVRLHVDYEAIQQFTLETVRATKKEGTKVLLFSMNNFGFAQDAQAYKHAYYRHAVIGPELNVYALTWCEAEFERLKLLIEFVELIWSHDG